MGHLTTLSLLLGAAVTALALDQSGTHQKRSAADGNSMASLDDFNSKLSELASSFPGNSANQYGISNLPKIPGMGQSPASSASVEKSKRSAADGNSMASLDDFNSKLSELASSFPGNSANQYGISNLPKIPGMGQSPASSASVEKSKRSAADGSSMASLDDFNSKLSELASSFPGNSANQYGISNLPKIPGMGQSPASSASVEKSKRSAADGSSMASLDDFNSKLSELASSFPGNSANQYGISNLPKIPGMGQSPASSASVEKSKRSAADGSSMASLDDFNSKLSELASSFPGNSANQYGISNLPKIPGMGQSPASSASVEKSKRSAADGNSMASLDDFNSKLNELASSFPGNSANQYGISNLPKIPGMGQSPASSASVEKSKRSAADGSSMASLDDFNSKLSELASSFPGNSANQYGISNLPKIPGMGQSPASSASVEKSKRSAADGSSMASLDDFNSKLSELASSFPGNSANQYGISNLPKIPGMGQSPASSASVEKSKRSAADGNSMASLDDFNSKLSELASSFPGNSANQYGISNLPKIPGMGQSPASSASVEKSKRSAADGSSMASLDDFNSKLSELASSFPGNSANQYGISNLPKIPGMGQSPASSASVEKSKRSAADGSSMASLDDFNSKLSELASSFPGNSANQYGISNLPKIPGMGQSPASSASVEKSKRSAADGSSMASLDDFNSKLSELASSFPGNSANQYGISNLPKIPGMGQSPASSASVEKSKRSAADGSSMASLDDFNSKLSELASSFPGNSANQYGISNLPKIPGMGQSPASSASVEKSKRSAADGSSMASLDDFNSKLSELASSFPGNSANQYGISNLPKIPGMGQSPASSASVEKSKRSAADGSSMASLDDFNSKLSELASSFPGNSANQYGISNLPKIPGMGQSPASSASVEKSKRSSTEPSPSWTEKLKSLFTGSGAE